MKVFSVSKNEDGMRLDKLIERLLPQAEPGFKYKMLRKKNIVLNGKRATGSERVAIGDEVKLFLSDETIDRFTGSSAWAGADKSEKKDNESDLSVKCKFRIEDNIIFEDDEVILVNKPVGILTQKACPEDVSLNEYLIDYLLRTHKLEPSEMVTFKPSVCNRLDRNTSGIVCCGVGIKGLRKLSEMFRDRTVRKYYLTIVKGKLEKSNPKRAWLIKDEKTNKVTVSEREQAGAEMIETAWRPLKYVDDCTLAEVELFTGKSHQIRAHLAYIGHPVAGDTKYGDSSFNAVLRKMYGIKSQLLTAYRIVFPTDDVLTGVSGKEFTVNPPKDFFINV